MGEKLAFRLLLIRLQGGIEDRLKIGGESNGVNLGHTSCERATRGLMGGREGDKVAEKASFRPRVLTSDPISGNNRVTPADLIAFGRAPSPEPHRHDSRSWYCTVRLTRSESQKYEVTKEY